MATDPVRETDPDRAQGVAREGAQHAQRMIDQLHGLSGIDRERAMRALELAYRAGYLTGQGDAYRHATELAEQGALRGTLRS